MPELPEVETVRRGLEPVLTGKVIEDVKLRRKDLRTPITPGFAKALSGRKILSTARRGKYIIVFLEGGRGFVLHLGMSGRIRIAKKGAYKTLKHDHIILRMKDGTYIAFNDARRFGMAYLVDQKDWKNQKPFSEMGPEPLEEAFTGKTLFEKLKGKKTPVKTALLDQRIVAGVGNIYACEALFMAGIDPLKQARDITAGQAGKLAQAIRN
ncbi:MAG: bifunctional DNA-formamidopyrimidine glycosylase/DNA-(apurinic or apyrimidinic site) lyase, partial [Alphaproteobacteria bacterium]|nr:bifunctional DNA-formamidopyrimidine glycosylase/DNA-(apurinic or apyrimidinic site) lyase [Alphaproteobacteria bacterium]